MRALARLAFVGVLLVLSMGGVPSPSLSGQGIDSQYFPQTRQTVKGIFWKYWQEHGGVAQQGYPISAEMQEKSDLNGKTYTIQYFERAVFEHHPDNKPPYDVLLAQLGTMRYRQKYPKGAPGEAPNGDAGTVFFPQTGKHVGGSFLAYWRSYGSVAQQGYPISNELREQSDLDGKIYMVQYFERAVFEWHPENQPPYNVLLTQLGTLRYRQKYAPPPPPTPTLPINLRDWTTPRNVSNSPLYDNNPVVAASPINGAVTVGWEQRDDAGANDVVIASNTTLDEPFRPSTLRKTGFKESGGVRLKHDSLGRRHMVWWEASPGGASVCNFYARIETDGKPSIVEAVPNSCGKQLRNTALAVGPDNSAHMIFGEPHVSVFYYQRAENGSWPAQGEVLTREGKPTFLTATVSSNGVVMAAFRADAPGSGNYGDIYTAIRRAPGAWAVENVSSTCCAGCPGNSKTYVPALAADPSGSGGIRLSWSDEQCEPRQEPRQLDIYYREWLPVRGWDTPEVRVMHDPGESYFSAIAVDDRGTAHIVYDSDIGAHGFYRIFYVSGSGAKFSQPVAPFMAWGEGSAFQKYPSMDYALGYLHVTFNTEHGGNKEVYYTNKQVGR